MDGDFPTDPWRGFAGTGWRHGVDVRDFIRSNVRPYEGDERFLARATERTKGLWASLQDLFVEERRKGVLDVAHDVPSSITAHAPGWIDKDAEKIVGLQTDAPLKRSIMPFGGWRMVVQALETYGYPVDPALDMAFTRWRKTHNDAVFDVYSEEVKRARSSHVVTGLPDAYGRGRIIGDYRRVALYGVDRLIEEKRRERAELDAMPADEAHLRLREELAEQVRALQELREMAGTYGFDIARPASDSREAIQWLYFAYLAAVKQQNGAAMSLGRTASFLDIYIERDLQERSLKEHEVQELVDDFVIKLRIVRQLRTPAYDELFSGDPTWVTEVLGGMGEDGRTLVTRTAFRYLQTLYNLGPAPEPNITVLWSNDLPLPFKRFCAQVSIDTSSIQYENDDLIRARFGDDTGIACCVSAMRIGKQMQFFGARVNLAKTLLYAINDGRDEITGAQVAPGLGALGSRDVLDFEEVRGRLASMMAWLAGVYVEALNCIHWSHDKYAYESLQMALHDRDVLRTMACGIAGLAVATDSLAAIRYARVRPVWDERGLAVDFEVDGAFPTYGNMDDRADEIAVWLVEAFMDKVKERPTYRDAVHTQSVLTITSNVVYGKHTGSTPDGRKRGEAFSPGANPMNGRDRHGLLASALSVARLPYDQALDGISLTASILPSALGGKPEQRSAALTESLDAYFAAGGFHLNVNVLDRSTLEDAMRHPENYPHLTVRVSGYAVNFVRLTPEQQRDVLARTFHAAL